MAGDQERNKRGEVIYYSIITSSKLLIATFNSGKFREYQLIFQKILRFPVDLISLQDLGITEKVEEKGKTYQENALIKAEFYFRLSGLPTLADDSGLEIFALDGWPGLHSRRDETGKDLSDKALIQRILKRLNGLPLARRKAQYRVVIAFIFSSLSPPYFFEGIRQGLILQKANKEIWKGFPFDSVFYLPEKKKVFVELSREEKAQLSQRTVALGKARKLLEKYFKD